MKNLNIFMLCLFLVTITSCAKRIKKAADTAKYSAYEMVGIEKRDLFKREVTNVKEEQEDTGEAFKDALTELKGIYDFDGGNLEKQHGRLKASLDDAKEEALELSGQINKVDKVANDLFEEWDKEIDGITSRDLRSRSSRQLNETKSKYSRLEKQLRLSEKKMAPVLTKLNDQVLFLKHNLNAQAIAGLKKESGRIQTDIAALMREVEASSKEAEELIKTL